MGGPFVISTGVIDNRSTSSVGRPIRRITVRIENNGVTSATTEGTPIVLIEVFTVSPSSAGFASQTTYALDQVSLNDVNQRGSVWTLDNLFADLNSFGVRATITSTGTTLDSIPTVTVFGKDVDGNIVASYRLYPVTVAPAATALNSTFVALFESNFGKTVTVTTNGGVITGTVSAIGTDYVQITEIIGDIVLIPFRAITAVL